MRVPARRGDDAGAPSPLSPLSPLSPRAALELVRGVLDLRPALVVSDFDGTLSTIVSDPWGATVLPLAQRALRRLAALPGVHVALLSGRTATDVAARGRIGGARYLGNHGIEWGRLDRRQRARTIAVEREPLDETHGQMAERLAEALPRLIPDPWLVVERKTPAVAFHYRSAPDTDAAARRVSEAVDEIDRGHLLVRFPGRRVLELRPPGAIAKGEAFRRLLHEIRPALAFSLGDDVSDALAFAELRASRDRGELAGLAVAVQARAEAPLEVARAADVVLASPREAARFLAGLERAISQPRSNPSTSKSRLRSVSRSCRDGGRSPAATAARSRS